MEYMNVKAKNNANLKDKPRVYFTCHPADMEKAFERICNDLFAAADCAVYYTKDIAAPIPAENRETDLGRMNLFVIPVTFRLLTQPSRAMDEDFAFAMEQHIPVLPIMLESGLESIYSRPDKFGTLQFLQPGVVDQTAISYEEKLKRYLDSVLIDDKTAERIRAAFDAYIFLSYRKKDRKYANELMRLIHANPVCRDIAIWYDEFLVPGESFSDSIEQALEKSQLFTLLVTPNLVNEDNYVRTTEYPMARAAGKDILPAEAVKTDHRVLERQYEGIPETVDVSDEAAFRQRLLAAVERIARQENDKDPAHNYLIGLAYLEGIDVEVDRQRGLELITSAAEAGLPEALDKLWEMCFYGRGIKQDYDRARYCALKMSRSLLHTQGDSSPASLDALRKLVQTDIALQNYREAQEVLEELVDLSMKTLGQMHIDTIAAMEMQASVSSKMGNLNSAMEMQEKVLTMRMEQQGEEHPDTLRSLMVLAHIYHDLGDYEQALNCQKTAYTKVCRVYGKTSREAIGALGAVAAIHNSMGAYEAARDTLKENLALLQEQKGTTLEEVVSTVTGLASVYWMTNEAEKARELLERYDQSLRAQLGEDHPCVLQVLGALATTYGKLGMPDRDRELTEIVYEKQGRVLGEEHPAAMESLSALANIYMDCGMEEKARTALEKLYALQKKKLGEDHPDTLTTRHKLDNLLPSPELKGTLLELLDAGEKAYASCVRLYGETDPQTLKLLCDLSKRYGQAGDHDREQELTERLLTLQERTLWEYHPDIMDTMKRLRSIYKAQGEVEKASELQKKILDWEHGEREDPSINLMNRGLLALENKEYEEAEDRLLECVALREKRVKDSGDAQARNDLAQALFHLGRVPTIPLNERLDHLEQARQLAHDISAEHAYPANKLSEAKVIQEEGRQKHVRFVPTARWKKRERQARLRLVRDFFLTPLPVLAALLLLAWVAKAVFFPSGWAPDLPAMEKLPLIGAVPSLVGLYGDGDLRTGFLPTLFRVVGVLAAGALPFTIAAVIAGYLTMLTRKLTRKRWACVLSVLLGFGLSMLLLRLIPGLGTGVLAIAFVVLLGIGFAVFPEKETYIVWMALLFVAICAVALWLDQTLLWFTLPGVGIKTFVGLVVLPWAIMTVAFILFLVADLVTYHRE